MVKQYGVYHKECQDGGFSAVILKKAIPEVSLHPFDHKELKNFQLPLRKGDTIYFVDICPSPELLVNLGKKQVKWIVIDHHISVHDTIEDYKKKNPKYKFEDYFYYPSKSGATACWDYFFKDKPIPEVLKFVEIMDLYNWSEEKNSKFIAQHTKMECVRGNLGDYEKLLENFNYDEAVEKGKIIYKKIINDVKFVADNAIKLDFDKEKLLCVNAVLNPSEIGHFLADKSDNGIGATYSIYPEENLVKFQIRGSEGDSALKFAKKYGGGGHNKAAGFTLPINKFIEILNKQ